MRVCVKCMRVHWMPGLAGVACIKRLITAAIDLTASASAQINQ